MTAITKDRINEYANSMFLYERLHSGWVSVCARFIDYIIGKENIAGKTVIDYAFGHGAMSLAFLKLGAKHVTSIDGSLGNVERFQAYCRDHSIENVDIYHANLVEEQLKFQAEIVWICGVLHHIREVDLFLERAREFAIDENSSFIFQYYNAKSLREFTIETCRNLYTYESEAEFSRDSHYMPRVSQLRARDDLAATHIDWLTAKGLEALLGKHGYYVHEQKQDFFHVDYGYKSEEFEPHMYVCGFSEEKKIPVVEQELPYLEEIDVLNIFARDLLKQEWSEDQRRAFSIALCNAHYVYLKDRAFAEQSVIEIFLAFMSIFIRENVASQDLSEQTRLYIDTVHANIEGEIGIEIPEALGKNLFTRHLQSQKVRI